MGITRKLYDKRKLPDFIFTQDYSINDRALYLKDDIYDTYHYNYDRLIRLFQGGIIKIKEEESPIKLPIINWEEELRKCKESPYYFYITYCKVAHSDGTFISCTTFLTEEEFNNQYKKYHNEKI